MPSLAVVVVVVGLERDCAALSFEATWEWEGAKEVCSLEVTTGDGRGGCVATAAAEGAVTLSSLIGAIRGLFSGMCGWLAFFFLDLLLLLLLDALEVLERPDPADTLEDEDMHEEALCLEDID